MADEYSPTVIAELTARVADNLARWMFSPSASVTLLNVSENATFALREPDGRELVLRVHRVGYSSAEEIRSELAWMSALHRDGVIETAAAVPGADGQYVQVLPSRAGGPPRFAVAFERLPGTEPDSRDARLIRLEHGEPIRFGPDRAQGLRFSRYGSLEAVDAADADTDSLPAPRKHPGIAGRSQFAAHQQYGFGLVTVRRIHVVLRAHTEPADARIESSLFQQHRPVAGGIDDHAAAQLLSAGANPHYYTVLEYWSFGLSPQSNASACFGGPLPKKLEHAAHIDDAHPGLCVIVYSRVVG